MLPVYWTFTRSDDTDTSESLQTASTDCKLLSRCQCLVLSGTMTVGYCSSKLESRKLYSSILKLIATKIEY